MSVTVRLTAVETTRLYVLDNAPLIEATDPKRLTIRPTTMRVDAQNNAVFMVSVEGLVQRRDAKPGTPRRAVWTAAERWSGMPDWVADYLTSTGVLLKGKAK